MARPVDLYVDLLSQPARAITLYCRLIDIPHTINLINIGKKQHQTEEFARINPHKKIPAINDNGFAVYESHTIMRYLSEKFQKRQYYPTDLKKKTLIDEYLDWHHTNIRPAASGYFRQKFLLPLQGIKVSEDTLAKSVQNLQEVLKSFENVFLKDTPFINSQEMSIADLSAYSELEQLELIDYDWRTGHPKLTSWGLKIRQQIPAQHLDEVFGPLYRVAASQRAKRKQQQPSSKL